MTRSNGNSNGNGTHLVGDHEGRRFWVAGATGFLGSHLVRVLGEHGHDVVAVSRRGGPGVAVVDVLDEAKVAESARGADGAFLAFGKVSRDPNDAEELHRSHVVATRSALAGLRRAGVRRVVVASTSGTIAIGTDPDEIFDEQSATPSELIARFPYYRSKLYAEREALEANASDFEVVVVNPSLLLGPGDVNESSTGDVRRFLERGVPALPTGGMAFVDVRDAALGMLLAFERGRPGARYLLNAKNLTLGAFFQRLERMTGVPAPRLRLPASRPLALGINDLFNRAVKAIGGEPIVDQTTLEMAQYYWYCTAERAERELGWKARDTGATLRDTVDDLVSRGVTPRSSRPYQVRSAD
jgi:dihydroflavonol-4-reductase